MKIITTLALIAGAAYAAPDWRAQSLESLDIAAERSATALHYQGSTRRKVSLHSEALQDAMAAAISAYSNARIECDEAEDGVTEGQLRGLLLRSQTVFDLTDGLVEVNDATKTVTLEQLLSTMTIRQAYRMRVLRARHRLASFLETQ